jgi:hypothetical protein
MEEFNDQNAKSLKIDGGTSSVMKFQSKVRTSPAVALKVCAIAEPPCVIPLPRASRPPVLTPKKAARFAVDALLVPPSTRA